jgi:hypothetical protein
MKHAISTEGSIVKRGFGPRIHHPSKKSSFKRWIAGSSPAMTNCKLGDLA